VTERTPKSSRLFPATEEIRRLSALIAGEVLTWPKVASKKMFGMNSLYRGAQIFAALPDKRAFFSGQCLIFKLHRVDDRLASKLANDSRVNRSARIGAKWFGYELDQATDVNGAIGWLSEAYEQASPAKGKKSAAKKQNKGPSTRAR
jgi:hypothetical protein